MKKLTLLAILLFSSLSFSNEYLLIVNKRVPVDKINAMTIKKIYTGRQLMWNDKIKVSPCFADWYTETGRFFFTAILKISERKFKKLWIKRVFAGFGAAPISKQDPEEVLAYVQQNPGGIGLVPKDMKGMLRGVKVLEEFK